MIRMMSGGEELDALEHELREFTGDGSMGALADDLRAESASL